MEALRNIDNQQNPFGMRAKGPRNNVLRKPLRGVENKMRNISVKASFKDRTNTVSAKENINIKSLKPVAKNLPVKQNKPVAKKEVLPNIVELKESLPVVEPFSAIQIPDDIENIDAEDKENPQLVSCYINEIYAYMRRLECSFPIRKNHLQLQSMITGKMRGVLVDWLVQVHLRFHLLQETLYMSVSILDRFLQMEKVKRSELQLAGVSAMFIASKFEEMYAPDIADFVYITDNTYSKQDILRMEKVILKNLDFNLSKPLPLHFLRRNSKAGYVDATTHALAKYLMELTLPEYDFAPYFPSLLAAASLYLSLRLLTETQSPWSDTLKFYSTYSEADILPVVRKLCKVVLDSESSKLQAIRVKYSSSKFLKISTISQLQSSTITELAGGKK